MATDLDYQREKHRDTMLHELARISDVTTNGLVITQFESVRWGGAKAYYEMPDGSMFSFTGEGKYGTFLLAGEALSRLMHNNRSHPITSHQ